MDGRLAGNQTVGSNANRSWAAPGQPSWVLLQKFYIDTTSSILLANLNTICSSLKIFATEPVLSGAGAQIDTTTANGRFVFGIFAALVEFIEFIKYKLNQVNK